MQQLCSRDRPCAATLENKHEHQEPYLRSSQPVKKSNPKAKERDDWTWSVWDGIEGQIDCLLNIAYEIVYLSW